VTRYSLALLPGDGIGVEVMDAALAVLDALEHRLGTTYFLRRPYPGGAQCYADTGSALSAETMSALKDADVILFGAMGLPHIRYPDGTEIAPQLDIRMELELYAGVRPIRALPGLASPLSDPRAADIDFVLVREQTEGLFYARGRAVVTHDDVLDTMRISRAGTTRVADFALALGARRKLRGKPGRVTCVDKANVFTSMAFFREVFVERAALVTEVRTDCAYIDATALNLVLKPWTFDVLVTENMFGDILSDLAAALIGGMGMAPSGDIGDEHALFQPAHGSAPDIVGTGRANPTAMLLSVVMMLDWLAERDRSSALADAAALLDGAIASAFAQREIVPFEFGGTSGTREITAAVISALQTDG